MSSAVTTTLDTKSRYSCSAFVPTTAIAIGNRSEKPHLVALLQAHTWASLLHTSHPWGLEVSSLGYQQGLNDCVKKNLYEAWAVICHLSVIELFLVV